MKVEIEIGKNLRKAIIAVINRSIFSDVGDEVKKAFNLDIARIADITITKQDKNES